MNHKLTLNKFIIEEIHLTFQKFPLYTATFSSPRRYNATVTLFFNKKKANTVAVKLLHMTAEKKEKRIKNWIYKLKVVVVGIFEISGNNPTKPQIRKLINEKGIKILNAEIKKSISTLFEKSVFGNLPLPELKSPKK